jgi:hypothetical protein
MRRLCICRALLLASLVVMAGSAVYAAFDPLTEPSLIGWWKCDEGDGDLVADASPNQRDGTFVMGPAAWTSGVSGSAISLSGETLVEVPAVNLTLTEATMAGWLLPSGVQSDWSAVLMHRPLAHGLCLLGSRQLAYSWNDDPASWGYRGTAYYAADEWTHCAVTVEPTQATFYVNGAAICTNTLNHASADWNSPLWFGGDRTYTGSRHMNGALDDIMFFSRALTAAEVKALVPPQLKARKPNPADKALGVTMPLLQWTAGDTAIFHNVYLGTSPNLTEADLAAPRQPFTMYYATAGLQPGTTYYWRVDEIEADGTTIHTGDVWSFLAQDVKAYYPTPPDGAGDVSVAPVLTWFPGRAATKHHLYLGTSAEAVGQAGADTDKGELTDATFTPETLESLTLYYWRVDETIAGGEVKPGPVWSFITCLPVEDFESYTDDEGSRIYETWIDGWTNGTGSMVGYTQAPFAEQTIVHSGTQSMPLDYNNVNSPFYSEAEREFAPVQDWTINDANTLVLEVRGRTANAAATLYVAVEDASQHVVVVVNPDAAAVKTARWFEWKIPLSSFSGVNLAKVQKLYLGLGDRDAPAAGGAGLIFIDDIRVIRP